MRSERCILIVLYPQVSRALYLDSSKNTCKKDYTHIKSVLDAALFGFSHRGGYVRHKKYKNGVVCFGHNTNFCCVQQPETSTRDAFYVIHHMQEFRRDEQKLRMPSTADSHVLQWAANLASEPDDKLRVEFYRIQQSLASIIYKDVIQPDGMFFGGPQTRRDVDIRIELQGQDLTPLTKLGDILPERPKATAKK